MKNSEDFCKDEIFNLIEIMKPKIKKVLLQTSPQNRDDLEQDLVELIIKKMKQESFNLDNIPGFFELIYENQKKKE